jgi:prepilin-type N-terminal cleavage/methylation domain-containing protein
MKKAFFNLKREQKGFTLIELLVVIAILGVIAGVAVPNVGKFIGQGKQESFDTELHNLQTVIMCMLVESDNGTLDDAYNGISDMTQVTADGGGLLLSDYMVGLSDNGTVKTGCTYTISQDGGIIIQSTP